MSTITTAPDDLLTEVRAAQKAHQALLDRIDQDENVTALELAESEATVRLAEERVSLHERRAAAAAEAKRIARIREIHVQVAASSTRAAELGDLYDQLVTIGKALHSAATNYDQILVDAWRELRRLGAIPPEFSLDAPAGSRPQLILNGERLRDRTDFLGARLLGHAVREAAPTSRSKTAEALTTPAANPITTIRAVANH